MRLSKYIILTLIFNYIYPVENLVIIGSGPAGLSAATYATRAQLDPLVIQEETNGSQLAKASLIENHPGRKAIMGLELLKEFEAVTKELGTRFMQGTLTKIDLSKKPFLIVIDKDKEILANSIIIATGAKPTKLGSAGEDKYLGKGIAVCATCDAPLFKNKTVIVIGGNHTALREVETLLKYTDKIIIINKNSDISGLWQLEKKIKDNPNIKILNNHTALEIVGNKNWIIGVRVLNAQGKTQIIPAEGIFIAVGWQPVTELFRNQIELDSKNRIKLIGDSQTSTDGVFAAGDVTSKARHQVPVASNFGYIAAMDAEEYLKKNKHI